MRPRPPDTDRADRLQSARRPGAGDAGLTAASAIIISAVRPGVRSVMAMAATEIEAMIRAALPDARISVEDLAGDGDHYAATVTSEAFRGLSRVKQHQLVYAALRGRMGGELHALALQTSAPEPETTR